MICKYVHEQGRDVDAVTGPQAQLVRQDQVRTTELDEETRSQAQAREEVLVKRDKDAAAVPVETTSSIRNSHIMGAIALNTLCILP